MEDKLTEAIAATLKAAEYAQDALSLEPQLKRRAELHVEIVKLTAVIREEISREISAVRRSIAYGNTGGLRT